MIKVPVSSKVVVATWPRAGVPDYTFSVRSHGGPQLGADLQEFDWRLQVESRKALVSVEYFRSDADVPNQPIGLFRAPIDDAQLAELRKMIGDVKLFERSVQMKGHPGYTQKHYRFAESPHAAVEQVVNNSDHETAQAITPVPETTNRMLGTTLAHPERALRLGIARTREAAGDVFEVTATNIGVEKICFTDPRWILPTGPLQQSVVQIAESPGNIPGQSVSYEWKPIALPPLAPRPPKEPLVTLDPGGVWKARTAPHKIDPSKRYIAYFTWAHFPGEPTVDGVYRIRGRTDSARLIIKP
jgi:hypothetical protein